MDKTVIFYISNTGSIPVPPTNNIIQLTAEYEVSLPNLFFILAFNSNSFFLITEHISIHFLLGG